MSHRPRPSRGLQLRGLPIEALDAVLAGQTRRLPWQPGVVRCTAQGVPLASDGPVFERELADGRLCLRSGAGGRLELQPHHHWPARLLIPQSLNVLLSQQWARLGLMPLHAAVIRVDGCGVLALGPRGSGKSVLAAASLRAGAAVLTDDWCLLGKAATGVMAERLRGFLMLRPGWASMQLSQALPLTQAQGRSKQVMLIPEDDPRFPSSCRIDRIWLLQRPRAGRTAFSSTSALPAARALAELIKAGMPLLFSKDFPHERAALMSMLQALLASSPTRMIETGTDLVERPAETLRMLLAA